MNNNVVGMILAAGFGSRLQKLSQLRPKPLMELFGKAILFHQIKMLEQAGIKDIFINLHYHHKQLIAAVHSWSLKSHIHFSFEKDILGTAGGIRQVIKLFQLNNQAMIVLHGDMICDFDLKEIISPHAFCNLLIAQNKQTDGYRGAVSIDDNCRISELGAYYTSSLAKKKSGFFTGIHYISAQALQLLKNERFSCLVSEVYPSWLKSGKIILGDVRKINYEDLGTPLRLLKANLDLCSSSSLFAKHSLQHHLKKIPGKNIFCGSDVQIDPTAQLIEPLIIADRAKVKAHAIIGPNAIVGENSYVGTHSTIKNSLIMSDTIIEKDEELDCTIALLKARVLVDDKLE